MKKWLLFFGFVFGFILSGHAINENQNNNLKQQSIQESIHLVGYYYDKADNINLQKHIEFCLLNEAEMSPNDKMIVYHYTGLFLRRNNDILNALYYQNLYYEVAKSDNKKNEEVKALIELAVLYRESMDYSNVNLILNEVKRIIDTEENLLDINQINGFYYLHLGYYYFLLDKYDLAFENYNQSRQYLVNDFIPYLDLAEVETHLKYNELQKSFDKLEVLLDKGFENFQIKAEIFKNYGLYLIKSGKKEEGKLKYLKSFSLFYDNKSYKNAMTLGSEIFDLELTPEEKIDITEKIVDSYNKLSYNDIEYNLFLIQLERIKQKNFEIKFNEKKVEKQYTIILVISITLFFILVIIIIVIVSFKKLIKQSNIINKQNLEISSSNKKLEYFSYILAHDLRNIMSSNISITDLLKSEKSKERELFKLLNESNKSGLKLLEYLLDDAKSSVGSEVKHIDFDLVINEVLVLLENRLKENNILINKNELSKTIAINENQLYQILLNIIDNSIKYKDSKKNNSYIHLFFEYENNVLKLNFEDNGIGISPENIDKITKPFVQESHSQGVGLGLYIVKEIVDKYNGKIEVFSEKNVYTKIIVLLNL